MCMHMCVCMCTHWPEHVYTIVLTTSLGDVTKLLFFWIYFLQSIRDFLQSPLSRCHGSWKGVLIRSNCWDQAMLVVQVGSKGLTEVLSHRFFY